MSEEIGPLGPFLVRCFLVGLVAILAHRLIVAAFGADLDV